MFYFLLDIFMPNLGTSTFLGILGVCKTAISDTKVLTKYEN